MYQLEVKRWLVEHRFPPSEGWHVWVDVDAMEMGKGHGQKPGKAERALIAREALSAMGATTDAHPEFGRVDIVAKHQEHGLFLVEVEGNSSRQAEQAMYSALGQLLLQMKGEACHFLLAVPDEPAWEQQLKKVPPYVRSQLCLSCVLVSGQDVRDL